MGFSKTVLQTVPVSPPQYCAGASSIASCANVARLVLGSCGMPALGLSAPNGPVQRVAALQEQTAPAPATAADKGHVTDDYLLASDCCATLESHSSSHAVSLTRQKITKCDTVYKTGNNTINQNMSLVSERASTSGFYVKQTASLSDVCCSGTHPTTKLNKSF